MSSPAVRQSVRQSESAALRSSSVSLLRLLPSLTLSLSSSTTPLHRGGTCAHSELRTPIRLFQWRGRHFGLDAFDGSGDPLGSVSSEIGRSVAKTKKAMTKHKNPPQARYNFKNPGRWRLFPVLGEKALDNFIFPE